MVNLGPSELTLVFAVFVLLFGAKKLPELARGSGRALRIFKDEINGLTAHNNSPVELPADPMVSSTRGVDSEPPSLWCECSSVPDIARKAELDLRDLDPIVFGRLQVGAHEVG